MPGEFVVEGTLGKNAKFRDLAQRLASVANAYSALVRLWSFAALYRPDGDLTGIDPAEIPLTRIEWDCLHASRRPEPSSGFGFLEASGEVVVIHDWQKSQKYLMGVEKRRSSARNAGIVSAETRKATDEAGRVLARQLSMELDKLKGRQIRGTATHEEIHRIYRLEKGLLPYQSAVDVQIGPHIVDELISLRGGSTAVRTDVERCYVNSEPTGTDTAIKGTQNSGVFRTVTGGEVVEASIHDREALPDVNMSESTGKNGDGHFSLKSQAGPTPKRSSGPSPLIDRMLEDWLDKHFEWFYGIYPRREKRVSARKALGALHRKLLTIGDRQGFSAKVRKQIAKDISRRLDSGDWVPTTDEGRRHIPCPDAYLNQRRWDD